MGLAVARAALEAGRRNSRRTTPRPPKAMPANHDIGVSQIGHPIGISRPTLY